MPVQIKFPGVFTICGATGRGKSSLISYIFRTYARQFEYGLCFCPTSFDGDYSWLRSGVYDVINDEKISAFIDYKKQEEKQVITGGLPRCKPCFIIFDDCIGERFTKAFNRCDSIYTQLVIRHRHWNLSLFFSTQYTCFIPTFVRENTSYAFIFRQFSQDSWTAVYRSFGGHFKNKSEFVEYVEKQCPIEKYNAIVVNTRASEIEDMYHTISIPNPANLSRFMIIFGTCHRPH